MEKVLVVAADDIREAIAHTYNLIDDKLNVLHIDAFKREVVERCIIEGGYDVVVINNVRERHLEEVKMFVTLKQIRDSQGQTYAPPEFILTVATDMAGVFIDSRRFTLITRHPYPNGSIYLKKLNHANRSAARYTRTDT